MLPGIPVTPATFAGVQNVDIDSLSMLPEGELRPILPCLVRMSLCAPLDASVLWTQERKKILKCLSGIEIVNSLVGLLSIDFHELEQDARKELQLRSKLGGNPTESHVIAALPQGIALEFERCDAARKLRLLLSELLFIMYQIKCVRAEFYQKSSELFESEVYLEEVSDVLCIAQAELPSLLPIIEIAEVLLHVRNGAWLLCRVIANAPDSFQEVCTSLVAGGEQQDEDNINGQRRVAALLMLCDMCPSYSLTVRSLCVSHCKQPSVAVRLTIQHEGQLTPDKTCDSYSISGVVSFVSGLLLDNDASVRNWFSVYIRSGLKRKDSSSSVTELRQKLLDELKTILPSTGSAVFGVNEPRYITKSNVIRGCAFIRLYSALRCIAGLKFTDDENQLLLQLITCRPPPTRAGIRFASLGLCMLLACPNMIINSDQKAAAVDWIGWLVKEAEHFELMSGVRASFGGMLLLIAIHFHSNQTNAINDLVSVTLGMKSSLKSNTLAYMKTLFTQEIFNEQVVTAHAVKVAVTNDLNAHVSGYLAVHCIYHLLRSRTFAKHQVRITDWIYRQLCHCTAPIHPVIPSLIEAFVTSVIVPVSRTDCTNEPISEEELLDLFQDPFNSQSGDDGQSGEEKNSCFTRHILLVYYLLLYEDMLLNNTASIISWKRKVPRYSAQLMARLPIKYVLQQSQKQPVLYSCIYQPLLRLVATHYPHHCLVGDWLNEGMAERMQTPSTVLLSTASAQCSVEELTHAFQQLPSSCSRCASLLDQLINKSSIDLMPYRNVLVCNLSRLLDIGVSRHCQDLVQSIWLKMNGLFSTNLRSQTVNALRRQHPEWAAGDGTKVDYTDDALIKDPLIVLRCDDRVFRCPPLMEITLGNLEAFLQASRSNLTKHMQANPVVDKIGQVQSADDREKLRSALVAAQESAAVQILLECCLPKDDNEKNATGLLSDWREIQGIVCSHLHQMFIADPGIAKLVHFQGYPRELLSLTVAGIPSMHICLDCIAELIAQPQLDKQIFAIDLISYLSLQYALPKSLAVAKLAVNVMNTMLGVLPFDTRPIFFIATLPSLVRICRAFPPLNDDSVSLLNRLGRIVHSHLSVLSGTDTGATIDILGKDEVKAITHDATTNSSYASLYTVIFRTFAEIVGSTTLLRHQLQ